MIIYLIFTLMVLCFCMSMIEDYIPPHYYKYIVWGTIVLMVIISATRPGTNVSDYRVYEHTFYNYDSLKNQLSMEPTFLLLCQFFNKMGGTIRWVIWVYAIMSIPLKIHSLSKMMTPAVFFLAIPIYLGNFFQLHDCEQMRVAAALALGTYCYLLRMEGKKWKWIPFWLAAISMHHTAVALILPILITPNSRMGRYWKLAMIGAILLGVVFWIIKVNPIMAVPIPYIEAKMLLYEVAISNGEHPDILVYHPIVLLRIITFLYVLFYYDLIYEHLKCINLVLICEAIGLFCWFGLSTLSVFAVRMSELFEITEIIMFASVIYTVKPTWLAKLYPIAFAMYIFLYGCRVNQFGFL